MTVSFVVFGTPAPQGSKTLTRYGMREANKGTRPWREAVAWHAAEAMAEKELLEGPLLLEATFVFPRPKSHYGTGRRAGGLKATAPFYCATRPDVDKLQRAIGDAMAGIVYREDAQIVRIAAFKAYGKPHADIRVSEIAP